MQKSTGTIGFVRYRTQERFGRSGIIFVSLPRTPPTARRIAPSMRRAPLRIHAQTKQYLDGCGSGAAERADCLWRQRQPGSGRLEAIQTLGPAQGAIFRNAVSVDVYREDEDPTVELGELIGKRRRIKQLLTLEERLAIEARGLRLKAAKKPAGRQRDDVIRRSRNGRSFAGG